jgi:L-alanine-DL-glutamate epimerase-like enolase superfamily enzyme
MKITAVETVQLTEFGNVVWVRIHTDEGLVGLGETFRNPRAVIAYIHETCAPYLIGKDPLQVERHHDALMNRVGNHFAGFPSRSVEIRGNSAVDLALWDLAGKALECPVYQLLGGLVNERIRVYNTCAGYGYNAAARIDADTERAEFTGSISSRRKFEDLEAQVNDPAGLALSLLEMRIDAMKIWPFDSFARQTSGTRIALADLKAGVAVVEKIRHAVGDRMDVLIEFHSLWQLAPAVEIARALASHDIYWFEDPISMQNFGDLELYARAVGETRVAGSENFGSPEWYREAFTRRSISVANFDMGWTGGLTAGRRTAALAHAFDRPIAPHDCTGPVVFTANVHLLAASTNASIAEMVRAHYHGYYSELTSGLPTVEQGFVAPHSTAGLGIELLPDLVDRADASVVVSR